MRLALIAFSLAALAACGSSQDPGSNDGSGGAASVAVSSSRAVGVASSSSTGVSFSTTTSTGSSSDCTSADQSGCACTTVGATQACYSGLASQAGVGACTVGTQTCTSQESGEIETSSWSACIGQGAPSPEVCGDGIDNDCNGLTDESCATCADGQTQACTGGVETCVNGAWSPCVGSCTDGQTQSCTSAGATGSETCSGGQWGPCITPPLGGGVTGQPCTPGTATMADPSDPGCDYTGGGGVLYCEDSGVWECFFNSGCTYDACLDCLQQNCALDTELTGDSACDENLSIGFNWLASCGPDRSSYFSNLDSACPNDNVSTLNSCKFTYCINATNTGPCNFY